jgi:uncharacterized membrane protein YdjX (TVP38/TMEM64 family)
MVRGTTMESTVSRSATEAGRARRSLIPVLWALCGLAALLVLGRLGGEYLQGFVRWVEGLGLWGPAVFMSGYAVATVAFVPGLVLTLAAGVIFDLLEGTIYVFGGAVVGSAAAFLIARYVARGWVEQRVAAAPRFAAIDRAIGSRGRRIVLLLRLSPVFPFNLLNYALGLTRVSFRDYLIASIGMIPGTFMYVYFGKAAGTIAAAAGGEAVPGWTLWLGLAITVVVTVLVTRTARSALRTATEEGA